MRFRSVLECDAVDLECLEGRMYSDHAAFDQFGNLFVCYIDTREIDLFIRCAVSIGKLRGMRCL